MMKAVYIHIPFCTHICHYCDFSKIYYHKLLVDRYLIALEKEIKQYYQGELIKTIYIGGGTPTALNLNQLKTLFRLIKLFKLVPDGEFTIECNPENTDESKLILFKQNNINRLSIGVQTFNKKHLQFLGRQHTNQEVKNLIKAAQQLGFDNISVDLMYGFYQQSLINLKQDLKLILKYKINHLATYSLNIEPHTQLFLKKIPFIDEKKELLMYNYICRILKKRGYQHYEISNFSKPGYQSKHNLTYWDNEEYYGFGLGAHGYLNNIRYSNTKSITNYYMGHYRYKERKVTNQEQVENEMILGLRKITGINKVHFKNKYQQSIDTVFPSIYDLIKKGDLIDDGENIYIKEDKLYISNAILINFIK